MKRFTAVLLSLVLVTGLLCGVAYARASEYLAAYNAVLFAGDSRGEVSLSYSVTACRPVEFVGISKIRVYTESGTLVKTITGTENNGLLRADGGMRHSGDYAISGLTAGTTYYARVSVTAGLDEDNSDTKYMITNSIAAKS